MAMHLARVGGRFVAAMAVLLAVAGNAAFAQEHKTYRCKVADVVSWGDDGHLQPDSNPRAYLRSGYDGVIIDTLTGAVTYANGNRAKYIVVQEGSPPGDWTMNVASAATDFIRIRAWAERPIVHFLVFGLDSFASGPCEVVR
jgi:hypothetical protein